MGAYLKEIRELTQSRSIRVSQIQSPNVEQKRNKKMIEYKNRSEEWVKWTVI